MTTKDRVEEIRKHYRHNTTDAVIDIEFLLAAYDEQVNITIDSWGDNAELQADNAKLREALDEIKDVPHGWMKSDIMPKYPCNRCMIMKNRAADAVK